LGHQLYVDSTLSGRETKHARKCFTEALAIFEEIGDQIELEKTLGSFGRFLADRGNLDESKVVLARLDGLKKARS